MAKCTECGAVVADDLKFCGYCGAKLNIVSEHLGTQILGNTQAILDVLAETTPLATFKVVGTATDGPLAGGLILDRGAGKRAEWLPLHESTVWWSDGEKLTEVSERFVRE